MVKRSIAPMQIRIHLIRHGLRRATFSSRRRLWLVRLINTSLNQNLTLNITVHPCNPCFTLLKLRKNTKQEEL